VLCGDGSGQVKFDYALFQRDYFVLKVTPMQFLRSICSQFLVVLVAALPLAAAAQPPTMKAIVLHESGGPKVLRYEDAPRPQPKDDEVLIRVIAAGGESG